MHTSSFLFRIHCPFVYFSTIQIIPPSLPNSPKGKKEKTLLLWVQRNLKSVDPFSLFLYKVLLQAYHNIHQATISVHIIILTNFTIFPDSNAYSNGNPTVHHMSLFLSLPLLPYSNLTLSTAFPNSPFMNMRNLIHLYHLKQSNSTIHLNFHKFPHKKNKKSNLDRIKKKRKAHFTKYIYQIFSITISQINNINLCN